MVTCPQCSTPAPTSTSRFCDRCGTALPAPDAGASASLDCLVCGRPYKTERGRSAHMAKVHEVSEAAPWRADDFVAEDVRTPWLAPPEQPPPRPVPGASSADVATQATTLPPPVGEPFRWSQPTPDVAPGPLPPPPPISAMPPSPGPAQPGPAYAAQGPATQVGPAGPLPPGVADATFRRSPYRSLKELSGVIGLLLLLEVLALLGGGVANGFLAGTIPPGAGKLDLFLKVDDNQWIAWVVAGLLASVAYIVIVVWLYRAYRNQLSLGISETRLPVSVVVVMCFIPVLNLVFMTLAVREIWRNADLQRNEWAARSRRSTVPKLVGWIWLAPVLAVVAFVLFAVIVGNRIGSDGVTNVVDARSLYVGRAAVAAELIISTFLYRRVFGAVTEQQERAHWHYQMGRGPAAPAPPAPGVPSTAFPTVPS